MARNLPWPFDEALGSLESSLDKLSSLWTAAGLPSITDAANPYRTVFTALQHLLIGKDMTVRLDDGAIELTVTEFSSPLDASVLAAGQFGDVRFAAKDVKWDRYRFDDVVAVMHNVHIRPGVPPGVVAAPVELTATLPSAALRDLLDHVAPQVRGELRDDGSVHLRWARRPGLGSFEVDVEAIGSTVWLKPRAVNTGPKRWSLPARAPAYPLPLPDLPRGLLLTKVGLNHGALELTGLLPEWRMDLPMGWLEDVVSQLGRAGRAMSVVWPPRLPGSG